jgi:hypothetical protein
MRKLLEANIHGNLRPSDRSERTTIQAVSKTFDFSVERFWRYCVID